jgi:hypothetical protein
MKVLQLQPAGLTPGLSNLTQTCLCQFYFKRPLDLGEQLMTNTCFHNLIQLTRSKAERRSVRQPLAVLDLFGLRIQRQQPGTAPEGVLDEE